MASSLRRPLGVGSLRARGRFAGPTLLGAFLFVLEAQLSFRHGS